MSKKVIKKQKVIKAWAVVDCGNFVSDGSAQLAIYFYRKGAMKWRKDMLGKEGKVVPCEIKLLK